jgi:Trypsin-like peptidase domain
VIIAVGMTMAAAACASPVPPGDPVAAAPPTTAAQDVPRPGAGALFDSAAPDAPQVPGSPPGLGAHFCSGSVVDTAPGDVVITAAHCVADGDGSPPRTGMLFVPGYHDGVEPFGAWTVTSAVVDPRWQDGADPAYDVAFLTVARADAGPIERLTGAYSLVVDPGPSNPVDAIGYPVFAGAPTVRSGAADRISPTQLELDAAGLYDGTSGGPWLRNGNQIIGVTGGYEQGGLTPDVSYASYFNDIIIGLLREATKQGAAVAG